MIHILNYICVSYNIMEINTNIYHKQLEKEECIICLDESETEWRELECHHRYHKSCIEKWIIIRPTCPLCMKDVNEVQSNVNNTELTNIVSIRRFVIFICIIALVLLILALCST